jgi:hypothetical protein
MIERVIVDQTADLLAPEMEVKSSVPSYGVAI